MKEFLAALCLCAVIHISSASVGYQTIILGVEESRDIVIDEGYVLQILSYDSLGQFPSYVDVGNIRLNKESISGFIVAGPQTLTFTTNPASQIIATFRIFQDAAVMSEYIPSTSIVIPSATEGNVEILLESSKDLVNWTPANPGTYNASTEQRFFRVRALKK